MPSFQISRDKKKLGDYTVTASEITIGRAPSCTVTIANPAISRNHVKIVQDAGVYIIRDLGSLNGCYVNGNKIVETPLVDGDEITIGPYRILFKETEAVETQPAEQSKSDPISEDSVAVHDKNTSSNQGADHSSTGAGFPKQNGSPATIQMPVQAVMSYKPRDQHDSDAHKSDAAAVDVCALSVTQRIQKLIIDHPLFTEKEMAKALRMPEYAKTKISRRKLRAILEELNLATPQKRLWYFVEEPLEHQKSG